MLLPNFQNTCLVALFGKPLNALADVLARMALTIQQVAGKLSVTLGSLNSFGHQLAGHVTWVPLHSRTAHFQEILPGYFLFWPGNSLMF